MVRARHSQSSGGSFPSSFHASEIFGKKRDECLRDLHNKRCGVLIQLRCAQTNGKIYEIGGYSIHIGVHEHFKVGLQFLVTTS